MSAFKKKKQLVRAQFGGSAEDYLRSSVHARGESLNLLLKLVRPQAHWRGVDVATGAGHTALAFAAVVGRVTAMDITPEMLVTTEALAADRGLHNVDALLADAEHIPIRNDVYDLLLCRLAFHHFSDPEAALREFARVLRPAGILGFADNYTVDDEDGARWYNRFETIRDPSHYRVYGLQELKRILRESGFTLQHMVEFTKEFEFHDWADRQRVSEVDKGRLLDMMREVPRALQTLFRPRWERGTMYFHLREVVIVATLDDIR